MSMDSMLKSLICKLVSEELNEYFLPEAFRGFNIKALNKFDDFDKRKEYAEKYLPYLGSGGGRAVFGLGAGKILKLSLNSFGIEQNRKEIDRATDPTFSKYVTKLFNYDKDGYEWLVSEGVKVFADNADLLKKITPSEDILEELVTYAIKGKSFKEALEKAIAFHNKVTRELKGKKSMKYRLFTVEHEIDMNDFNDIDMELFRKVYEITKLGAEDIDRYDHWGVTSEGRVVAVDYGID